MATVFPRFKDQILYHRSFIPGKLQSYFKGRSQLWRSLRTSDRELAVVRSSQWTARIHRLFLTLKRQGASMTNAQRDRAGGNAGHRFMFTVFRQRVLGIDRTILNRDRTPELALRPFPGRGIRSIPTSSSQTSHPHALLIL